MTDLPYRVRQSHYDGPVTEVGSAGSEAEALAMATASAAASTASAWVHCPGGRTLRVYIESDVMKYQGGPMDPWTL